MAGLVTLTGGTFQDAMGNLLSNGYLICELSQDEQLSMSQGQAVGGRKVKVLLGTDGNVLVSPAQQVWPTDEMNPGCASYTVWGYTAEGQLVWGPNYGLLVTTGSTYNVDGWVPNQIGGCGCGGAPVGSLLLQTNGVNNGSQQLLNLAEGSGITIVDDGIGDITISAASTVVNLMTTDWHKLEFSNLTGSPTFNGDGISVSAANLGGNLNGIQGRAPFGANPAAIQIGGAQPQEAAIYEYGVDVNLGAVNSGPINLSTLVRWQASVAVGTMYLGAWVPNTRVPSGTVLKVSTTYYVQTGSVSSTRITGAGSAPSFNSTPGQTTSDNSATWTSVGTTRPITFGDHMLGISDYEGTNIGGSGYGQYPLGGDPTLTNAPGPAYNFIGFRYLPEPLASNGSVGDVHWMAYAGGVGMAPIIVDTGIAPDNSGATHVFAIKQPTANSITFYIDGTLVATIAISGLTNAFQSLIYGSNQQGDYDYSYAAAQAVGLGASVYDSGNWWECVAAGTTTGITFTASPSAGQIDIDGAVSWMCVWGSGSKTNPMAIAPAYIFWETSE